MQTGSDEHPTLDGRPPVSAALPPLAGVERLLEVEFVDGGRGGVGGFCGVFCVRLGGGGERSMVGVGEGWVLGMCGF